MRYSNKIEKTFFQKYLHNPKISYNFAVEYTFITHA